MKHGTMSSGLKLPDKDKNNLVNETFFVKEPIIHDVYKTINNLRIKNINRLLLPLSMLILLGVNLSS